MNTTISSTDINKLRISLKWSWTGPVVGIASMIALFVMGVVTHTPGMTIMAASVAVALGAMWVSVNTALRRKIAQSEQR